MIRSISRLPKYYLLRIKRLRGDPYYLARGIGFGVFMGVLPLVPIQTLLLIPLSAALQVSTIAALIASIIVSNPLTFSAPVLSDLEAGQLYPARQNLMGAAA